MRCGAGRKENGAFHNFAYQTQWQHKCNFSIILSKPPATAFQKKKSHNTFQSQKQCVWSESLFLPLAWIIKSLLCVQSKLAPSES